MRVHALVMLAASSLLACEEEPPDTSAVDPGGETPSTSDDAAALCEDPGRVTLRRLNHLEYDNTLRDLLGAEGEPSRDLPDDDIGYGFDTIGDVLSVSPLHLERYEANAERLVEAAVSRPPAPAHQLFEAEDLGSEVGAAHRQAAWNLWSNGEISAELQIADAGEYVVRVRAWGQQAGDEPARMVVSVDREALATYDVAATQGAGEIYTERTHLEPGPHVVTVAFVNDYYAPDDPDPANRDRNLIVDWLDVEGPFGAAAPDPARRAAVMVCEPQGDDDVDCARTVLAAFGRRAWRRPLTGDELDRLMTLVRLALDEGDPIDVGVQLAMRAILLSPRFLYRVELDPEPESPTPHPLTDHELAARLSYFLWSTTPDEALLDLADAGRLTDPTVLEQQVARMLDDPRSRALVDGFADQWLYIRAMHDVAPDYNFFPDFDDALRASMIGEARRFFGAFLAENGRVADMMTTERGFVDARLAEHYDVELAGTPDEEGFVEVDLSAAGRGGLLTLGSTLTVTSFPTRTSPVKRGKWVLEQLLCSPPPPPPPGVETELGDGVDATATLRERLEQHRADPVCASCHKLMDPIGLGMENFDAIGAFRAMDGDTPVDASGTLPDGQAFDGALELATILAEDPRLSRCFAEKLMTYALGRGPRRDDRCTLDGIAEAHPGASIRDVVHALVQSPQFTHRRGEATE